MFKFSPKYPKSAKDIKIYNEIQKITADIIIHGDSDRIVNMEYSEKANAVAINSKLEILKGAGHGFNKKQSHNAIKLIERFYESYNKTAQQ